MIGETNLVGYKIRTFHFMREVGKGNFATVYEAFNEVTKDTVAIKAISDEILTNQKLAKLKELAQSEINVMKACSGNENIVRFIDNFRANGFILIVMEYCEGGSL